MRTSRTFSLQECSLQPCPTSRKRSFDRTPSFTSGMTPTSSNLALMASTDVACHTTRRAPFLSTVIPHHTADMLPTPRLLQRSYNPASSGLHFSETLGPLLQLVTGVSAPGTSPRGMRCLSTLFLR